MPFLGFTALGLNRLWDIVVARTITVQIFDDLGEKLFRFFVEVGNGNASGENSIIRVLRREVCSGFGSKVLKHVSRRFVPKL